MKNWFGNLGRKMQLWMIGRYGTDELSKFLVWAGLVLLIASYFRPLRFLSIFAWIVLIWSYFRIFSKNVVKRSRERETYMRLTAKIRSKINVYKRMFRERKTHRYFKCPRCKTMIRVPKGKGKIAITCRKCGNELIKTT